MAELHAFRDDYAVCFDGLGKKVRGVMGDLKPSVLWRHFLARALQNIRGLIKLLTRNTPEKTSLLSGPMDIAE